MQQGFLQIGPIKFYLYGFFIALGLSFLCFYTKKKANEFNLKEKLVENIFFVILVSSLLGGRLYHIFSQFSYYRMFPKEIFYVWQGGMGIFGAILGSIIGVYIYSKIAKFSILSVLNLFAPPLLLTQAIGRLGNYFNLEGFGSPTSLPWGIYIPIAKRPLSYVNSSFFHPTFFYEAVLCLLAFITFRLIRKNLNPRMYFSFYLITYGVIRIITESFRFDTWEIFGFKVAYLISGIMIVLGFVLYKYLYKHP